VIRWGKQLGKQRFKCKNCGILFTRNAPEQRHQNRFIWFKKWILERQTYTLLSRDSNLSKRTLQRLFYSYLQQSPEVKIIKRNSVHLRMDATYFKQFYIVCYQDDEDGYTQLIRVTDGEYFTEIKEDLDNLIKLGVQIESITTDGHKKRIEGYQKITS
jgi:AraC-like DNA-binding protein